jgi:hypothetical protein
MIHPLTGVKSRDIFLPTQAGKLLHWVSGVGHCHRGKPCLLSCFQWPISNIQYLTSGQFCDWSYLKLLRAAPPIAQNAARAGKLRWIIDVYRFISRHLA